MTIRLMRITCWIPNATNTHSQYVIFTAFHCNNGCSNAAQCYDVRALPVSLSSIRLAHYEIGSQERLISRINASVQFLQRLESIKINKIK